MLRMVQLAMQITRPAGVDLENGGIEAYNQVSPVFDPLLY